ncbi:hypothetical protein LEP1GSC050_0709 [Leptospira broomii serovar Hurstbridge str. 5399]|uniref:Uncharacterized protein n=1 Tax=Leptospira broomii serovar Hurstbridge str. 5399 TaxID=1049789 RepID=T0F6E3_9LEPT|nr:hypothetical protein LEP1GSC050_0709 [Leptospira broomii serovar Hurstbridge str. 5399]
MIITASIRKPIFLSGNSIPSRDIPRTFLISLLIEGRDHLQKSIITS